MSFSTDGVIIMALKILVVTSGINPKSGGPTRSCKGMCRALSQADVDVTLLVLGGRHPFENPCGVKVCYAVDAAKCQGEGEQWNEELFDLVHLQGLWNPKLHAVVKQCRRANVPYVISPRGMLDPWALSVKKWKKCLALLFYQRSDLKHAAAFHATAELEARNIRAQGLTQPIIIAPNGVDVPVKLEEKVRDEGGRRTAIFLGRLHPGKGLLALAEAWAKVKPRGWTMRIVGPDTCGHKAEVLKKLDALGIPHCEVSARTKEELHKSLLPTFSTSANSPWEFVPMVSDKNKWLEYVAADVLIHPSVSENFGITIAEGLAAGLPVICTKGTPWKEIETHRCGWSVDVEGVPLVRALAEATASSDIDLMAMGERGRALIMSNYSWSAIVERLILGYKQLLEGFSNG